MTASNGSVIQNEKERGKYITPIERDLAILIGFGLLVEIRI